LLFAGGFGKYPPPSGKGRDKCGFLVHSFEDAELTAVELLLIVSKEADMPLTVENVVGEFNLVLSIKGLSRAVLELL
jgi:hypothetical protein